MQKTIRSSFKHFLKHRIIGTQHEGRGYIDNILRIFDRNIQNAPIRNLLDIGCANGYKTSLFADYFKIPSSQIFGLDIVDEYLYRNKIQFNVIKSDLEDGVLPFKDNSFDLVMCNQVLEHLVNFENILMEIIRITRIEGHAVVGIPNLAHLINRIYLLCGYQPLSISIKGAHLRGFTHNAFINFLNTIEEISLIDSSGSLMYPFPWSIGKYLAKHFVGLSGYTCYLIQKKKHTKPK